MPISECSYGFRVRAAAAHFIRDVPRPRHGGGRCPAAAISKVDNSQRSFVSACDGRR
jgi:hypothetical protein